MNTDSDRPSQSAPIEVEIVYDRHVQYALQQNNVRTIKRLVVHHRGGETVERPIVKVALGDHELAPPLEFRLPSLAAGDSVRLDPVDLALDPDVLRQRTERQSTRLTITIETAPAPSEAIPEQGRPEPDQPESPAILEVVHPIDILSFSEWGGLRSLPELLAAFVLPNRTELDPLLVEVAAQLRAATGDGALDGYQRRDSRRVQAMIRCCYGALVQRRIGYILPPPSFEQDGQKIRMADQVLGAQPLGTCLDLTLVFAALLERIGLHPVLVLVENHAFVACWVRPELFAEPCTEDGLRLRKRVDLDEILLVDAVAVSAEPAVEFDHAQSMAARQLTDLTKFQAAVDVVRARRLGVRPLPLGSAEPTAVSGTPTGDGTGPGKDSPSPSNGAGSLADQPAEAIGDPLPPTSETDGDAGRADQAPEPEGQSFDPVTSRLDRWQRKLLDLTFRNRLVNFRETKASLQLCCSSLAELEDALATGKTFTVHPRPEPRGEDGGEDGPRDPDRLANFLRDELADRRVHATSPEDRLEARLLAMWRHARAAIQESGANSLYLALGTLVYYESESSEVPRRAPLLLLPMRIERQSASRGGFRIVLADEEPHVNATLLEKLGTEFPIDTDQLDRLDPDESGLDVDGVLRRFREAILHIDRWDVVEEAWIAPFSFTKFLMWLDLKNRRRDLLASPVLRRLLRVTDAEVDTETPELPDDDELDRAVPPAEVLAPMDADSSQLRSIVAAADGHSFVLEGPPGTGKSQTITNLIAHCIGRGQRVLFVAEKQAALEVVKQRLDRVGLGAFCLELHSQKASKRAVVQQLCEPFDAAAPREPTEWRAQAGQLERTRVELNDYVDELHRPGPFGESPFQVFGRLGAGLPAKLLEHATRLADTLPVAEIDSTWRTARIECVSRLIAAHDALSHGPNQHPLRAVRRTRTEARLVRQALAAVQTAKASHAALVQSMADWLAFALPGRSLDPSTLDRPAAQAWVRFASLLTASPRPARRALEERDSDWVTDHHARAIAELEGAIRARQRALAWFPASAIEEGDDEAWCERARQARDAFWPLSWWRGRAVRRALRDRLRPDVQPPRDRQTQVEWFELLVAAQTTHVAVHAPDHAGQLSLGRPWRQALEQLSQLQADGDSSIELLDSLREAITWVQSMRETLRSLERDPSLGGEEEIGAEPADRTLWIDQATEADPAGAPRAARLKADHEAWQSDLEVLDELLELDGSLAWAVHAVSEDGAWLRHCAATLDQLASGLEPQLDAWCHWRRIRSEGHDHGLQGLVDPIDSGGLAPRQAMAVFDYAYRLAWLEHVMDSTPRLGQFHSGEHQRRIDEFVERDIDWMDTTAELLRARLAAHVPRPHGIPVGASEVGILLREAKKKTRHLPVRRLFAQLPNLLPRLKPCFLMSPLSVAQFLDTSVQPFDLVVFDEASQITPWDAVGAIARGKSSIVVGDSKQLPPTNFFQRGGDADDEPDDDLDFEELESILDECSAGGLPALRLRWHYRSRHESLIAFSNHHYYGNDLLTFPSPAVDSEHSGVRLVPVPDGVYDRSASRTNRLEAESVVREVVARLRNPEVSSSIGVVTFSRAQQALIEDLLDAERRSDPGLERWFVDGDSEPVFVKNLENVQGDERDTILFSVCYGPDAQGRVAMNFGPLNIAGGERRLNVAITRARYRVLVHSTLRADQIDLARTRATGVAHLKSFLEYAERGAAALEAAIDLGGSRDHDSPFERQVAEALRGAGHDVVAQVGCSGYRIDLAVRDPNRPGRFVLGIECDGAAYHSAKTARDRDRLRQSVLEGLGWSLHRVWSTDWWRSRERELDKLNGAIEQALEAARKRDTRLAAQQPTQVANQQPGSSESSLGATETGLAGAGEDPEPPQRFASAATEAPSVPPSDSAIDPIPEGTVPAKPTEALDAGSTEAASPTTTYSITAIDPVGPSEHFGRPPTLDPVVRRVVETEGPMAEDLLCRRVGAAWGITRVTQKIRDTLRAAVERLESPAGLHWVDGFVWPGSLDPSTWRGIRVPSEDRSTERDAEDLPVHEVANAIDWIVRSQVALPVQDLIREVCRTFGFARVGSRVKERVELGLALALEERRVTIDRRSDGPDEPDRGWAPDDLVVAPPPSSTPPPATL